MRNLPFILYALSGILIALGGAGHSFAAVAQVHAGLSGPGVDPHLIRLILAVWHFAGAAMAVLGLLVLVDAWARRKGDGLAVLPWIVGGFYVAYGIAALAWMREPFWALFVVYGALAALSGSRVRTA